MKLRSIILSVLMLAFTLPAFAKPPKEDVPEPNPAVLTQHEQDELTINQLQLQNLQMQANPILQKKAEILQEINAAHPGYHMQLVDQQNGIYQLVKDAPPAPTKPAAPPATPAVPVSPAK